MSEKINCLTRVDHSIEVIWDGIKEYKAYKDEYDFMGNMYGISGIEYTLIRVLCQGDRFCHHAEALVKKTFGLQDSPLPNSHYDAQFYHPLYGLCTLESRCLMGYTSTSHSSEIGGGGRSATEKTEANGGKTFKTAHQRALHKLYNTTFFAFCDIKFMPRLHISIIRSETILELWRRGIYAIQKGKNKGLLPQSIGRDSFYKMFYGQTNLNVGILWEKKNPWGLSQQKQDENISIFDNERGYYETLKRLKIKKQTKIDIDKEISDNPLMYDEIAVIAVSKKKMTEIVDIF
jgi:hypothetical protein